LLCVVLCAVHAVLPSFPTRRSSDLVPSSKVRPSASGCGGRWRGCGTSVSARTDGRTGRGGPSAKPGPGRTGRERRRSAAATGGRSEEHTSELQSRENIVCRLLLEKK